MTSIARISYLTEWASHVSPVTVFAIRAPIWQCFVKSLAGSQWHIARWHCDCISRLLTISASGFVDSITLVLIQLAAGQDEFIIAIYNKLLHLQDVSVFRKENINRRRFTDASSRLQLLQGGAFISDDSFYKVPPSHQLRRPHLAFLSSYRYNYGQIRTVVRFTTTAKNSH